MMRMRMTMRIDWICVGRWMRLIMLRIINIVIVIIISSSSSSIIIIIIIARLERGAGCCKTDQTVYLLSPLLLLLMLRGVRVCVGVCVCVCVWNVCLECECVLGRMWATQSLLISFHHRTKPL